MGLEDVTKEIKEDAEAEANQILDEAEAKKEQIIEEAKEEKEQRIEQAREEAEQEAEALRKKKLSSAKMDARKLKQEARQDVLEEAFEQFRSRIMDMDAEDEQDLVEDALDRLDDRIDIGTIITSSQNEDVASGYGDVETEDLHGAIVESADGTQRFDLTFDTVADKTIDEHKKDVSQVLF